MNRLRNVNPEQLASLLRTFLQVIGGVLVAQGYATEGQWAEWSGAALIILPTLWGLWARSDTNLIKSAADVPAVDKVVTEAPVVAASIDRKNVTAS